ncbi:MAG: radical SAM protein [bacterium]|nr:radical SAM protein [bacterium]
MTDSVSLPTGLDRLKTTARLAGRLLTGRPVIFNLNVYTTRLCNQQCPMCNAELDVNGGPSLTLEDYKGYLNRLKHFAIPSVTFSGGEPTIAPELPDIIAYSAKQFPFRMGIVSNFYGRNDRFRNAMTAALKHNVNIGCSFDGFGEVADKQRGARNVSEIVTENLKWVTAKAKELNSKSPRVLNTVISDTNLHQVMDVLKFSQELGWQHRISCVNSFYYYPWDPKAPTLTYNKQLFETLDKIVKEDHIRQNKGFIKGIAAYAQKKSPKFCPFITWPLKTAKVFMDHNGDISLCDRHPIGNIKEKTFEEMIQTPLYGKKQQDHKDCAGCWLPCFVEPITYLRPFSMRKVTKLFDQERERWNAA